MDFFLFSTPLGQMGLAADGELGAITRLYLPGDPTPRLMPHATVLLEQGREQLLDYLAGLRRDFDLPLAPEGTPFQQRVWAQLRRIPWGETRSYAQLARAVDCPKGFRAVGLANSRNPIPILIPCHRVIAADGSLGGWRGGPQLKQALLDVEAL